MDRNIRFYLVLLALLVTPSLGMLGYKQYLTFQAQQAIEDEAMKSQHSSHGEVLFFNASWCGPCRQMKPIVTQMRGQGYRLRDLDVDKNRSLAEKYNIHSIPTFVFIENGAEVNRFSGGTSADALRKMCNKPAYH